MRHVCPLTPSGDYEPEGYELIRFTGAISTLETDEDLLDEIVRDRFPFGFQAPEQPPATVEAPELSSSAWDAWLTSCT